MAVAAVDWVEWQANFFAGALLAPSSLILDAVRKLFGDERCAIDGTSDATRAILAVADRFDISRDAARVRLAQVGFIKARSDDQLLLSQNS
jgi:Zn-dependent peptidase ImmA (M78 family)